MSNPFASILDDKTNNAGGGVGVAVDATGDDAVAATVEKQVNFDVSVVGATGNAAATTTTVADARASRNTRAARLKNDDGDNEEDDDDDESESSESESSDDETIQRTNTGRPPKPGPSSSSNNNGRAKPPRPSVVATKKSRSSILSASAKRRRRRSSARFLQLGRSSLSQRRDSSGVGGVSAAANNDDDDDTLNNSQADNGTSGGGGSSLQDLYQKAIRMNAENKINAGNSWNLRLIENIDTFLEGDEEDVDNDMEQDDDAEQSSTTPNNQGPASAIASAATGSGTSTKRRVNFTKASCTLDASVKIYSYRVDDVHLTSYKVLANLNRTDNNKQSKQSSQSQSQSTMSDDNDHNDAEDGASEKQTRKKHASTLETHLGNINLNKLDSAFDIDPLFHKMSKTFDEGGAKGLLLVNLGVGENGCNIVFDSSDSEPAEEDNDSDVMIDNQNDESTAAPAATTTTTPRLPEGMVDVTSLRAKLDSLLTDFASTLDDEDDNESGMATIRSIPLVPQLSSLRAEHCLLEGSGFIDDSATALAATVGPKTPGKRRYHAHDDEERLADYSIHKEAMERSRVVGSVVMDSTGTRLRFADSPDGYPGGGVEEYKDSGGFDDDDDNFVDFGGNHGDYDDDNDDHHFDTFINTVGARYSDVSFGDTAAVDYGAPTPQTKNTMTSMVIDGIASGLISNNDYTYVNSTSLLNMTAVTAAAGSLDMSNNAWAGAAHWNQRRAKGGAVTAAAAAKAAKKDQAKKKKRKPKKKFPMDDVSLTVTVSLDQTPDLSFLFEKAKKATGRGAKKATPNQQPFVLSKGMITKLTNQENLLPADVGLQSVEQLTQLFLRPNYTVLLQQQQSSNGATNGSTLVTPTGSEREKTVSFQLGGGDWDDYGGNDDDDDGPGFDFGGDDDDAGGFADSRIADNDEDEGLVTSLGGIRKVAKVRVGYATVAKKVDVKRLKRDLWNQLEGQLFAGAKGNGGEENEDQSRTDESMSDTGLDDDDVEQSTSTVAAVAAPKVVTFQDTVRELDLQQSQPDVTLPFYFICILHLANEKGLALSSDSFADSDPLDNFTITCPTATNASTV